ncbi:MAG: DUF3782 domain-containing protein [Nodosilinea sp. LVE1205-7]|jgi:hypothetical protein
MVSPDLKQTLQALLPQLIAEDPLIRDFVLRTVSNYYSSKAETESNFDRTLARMDQEQAENARKWDESTRRWDENTRKWDENTRQWHEQHQQNMAILARMDQEQAENARRWDENTRKWDENTRQWHEQHQQNMALLEELKRHDRRYESTIGALGSRWGLYSEASFRSGLKAILEESFGVQVLNLNDFDESGEVFGRPDQVELDIIIKNGDVILCEIKSSMSKADIYSFDRKVAFYQQRHHHPVSRKLVISPMVDNRARPVAEALGIEVYTYAEAVENL